MKAVSRKIALGALACAMLACQWQVEIVVANRSEGSIELSYTVPIVRLDSSGAEGCLPIIGEFPPALMPIDGLRSDRNDRHWNAMRSVDVSWDQATCTTHVTIPPAHAVRIATVGNGDIISARDGNAWRPLFASATLTTTHGLIRYEGGELYRHFEEDGTLAVFWYGERRPKRWWQVWK